MIQILDGDWSKVHKYSWSRVASLEGEHTTLVDFKTEWQIVVYTPVLGVKMLLFNPVLDKGMVRYCVLSSDTLEETIKIF